MKRCHIKTYLWLFFINFFISAFTFGGGYVVIPMIRKYFVEKKGVFLEDELTDMAAVAQSSPGAIAVNLSVLAGYRTGGMAGAVVSGVSSVLPPLIILSVISVYYRQFRDFALAGAVLKGMEAGVGALMADIIWDMGQNFVHSEKRIFSALIPFNFLCCLFLPIPVVWLLALSATACFLYVKFENKRKHKKYFSKGIFK